MWGFTITGELNFSVLISIIALLISLIYPLTGLAKWIRTKYRPLLVKNAHIFSHLNTKHLGIGDKYISNSEYSILIEVINRSSKEQYISGIELLFLNDLKIGTLFIPQYHSGMSVHKINAGDIYKECFKITAIKDNVDRVNQNIYKKYRARVISGSKKYFSKWVIFEINYNLKDIKFERMTTEDYYAEMENNYEKRIKNFRELNIEMKYLPTLTDKIKYKFSRKKKK